MLNVQTGIMTASKDEVNSIEAMKEEILRLQSENNALRELSGRFEAIVNNFPFIILTLSPEGKVINLSGKDIQELEHVHKDWKNVNLVAELQGYSDTFQDDFARALKGESFRVERWYNKNFFEAWYVPRFADGVLESIIVVSAVITDKLEIKQSLEKERHNASKAHKIAKIGILERDYITNSVSWSGQMYEIHGIDPSDVRFKKEDYFKLVNEFDILKINNAFASATPQDPNFSAEYRMKHFITGETLYLVINAEIAFTASGQVKKVFGIIQDISELKRLEIEHQIAEERVSNILENMPTAFFSLDRRWKFVYANRKLTEIFDKSAEHLLGHDFFEEYPLLEHTAFDECCSLAMNQGISSSFELYIDFLKSWFKVSVQPSPDGIGVHMNNINHRKQTEKSLRDLSDAKTGFLRIIAHDMKGPFNSIIGLTNIAAISPKAITTDEWQKLMGDLNGTARNLHKLLDNLLTWSNSQIGQMNLQMEDVSLHEAVSFSCDLFSYQAMSKQIKLQNNVDNESLMFYADRQAIETVIRNLISNAIKFTKPGGMVSVYASEEKGQVVVEVKDTGRGIEKELQDKLFDMGSKVTLPGTAGEMGTGFGIKLAKELIEKNNGKIWLESGKGGTSFFFSIPKGNKESVES